MSTTTEVRRVDLTCSKCKTNISLDFTGLNYDEAFKNIKAMDERNMECPGFHVEFGGWRKRWGLDQALDKAYSDEEKAASSFCYRTAVFIGASKFPKMFLHNENEKLEQYVSDMKVRLTSKNEDLTNVKLVFTDLTFGNRELSRDEMTLAEWM